jgi:hypothetical protein
MPSSSHKDATFVSGLPMAVMASIDYPLSHSLERFVKDTLAVTFRLGSLADMTAYSRHVRFRILSTHCFFGL